MAGISQPVLQRHTIEADPDGSGGGAFGRDLSQVPTHTVQSAGSGSGPVLQRQPADIPPPPRIFPAVHTWFPHPSLHDNFVEAWNDTQLDNMERGFVVMWNERTEKYWAGDRLTSTLTISGNTFRHDITLPRLVDRPPVFPVGTFHTHPRPPKGMTSTPGPSYVDKGSLLPGVVQDSTARPYNPRASAYYFHGPTVRPETLPPGPLFPR